MLLLAFQSKLLRGLLWLHKPASAKYFKKARIARKSDSCYNASMDEQDDVKIEADEEVGEEKAESKVAKMRAELAECRREKQEHLDGWQRSKADYVNLLRRNEADTAAAKLKGKLDAVESLLPAFDALERAKDLPAQAGHGGIVEGFLAIAKQLEAGFAALGLEAIGAVGEHFDPALHEAFGQDATNEAKEDDTVTVVLEKGWRIGENIVRPAKVRVAHYAAS